MAGIGCHGLEFRIPAQEVILVHDPQHPFVVDFVATILEICGNPSIAVAGKFQSYLLNFVPQIIVFAILSGDCLLFFSPFTVAAATYIQSLAG